MNYKLKNVRPVAVSGAWNDSGAFPLLESGLNPLRIGEWKLETKCFKKWKKTVTTTQIVLPTLDLSIKKSGMVELFAIELITIAKL